MKRLANLFLLLPLVFLAPGCATSRSFVFEGVGEDGRAAPDVRYVLSSTAGNEGSVTLDARGRAFDIVDGRETDTVSVRLTVDNASTDPLDIPLDALVLTDDQNRVLKRLEMDLPKAPVGGDSARTLRIDPSTRTTLDFLYDLGASGVLRSTGSVSFDWRYLFRGQSVQHRTRFLPVRYYRSTYVRPYASFYYGPSYCW